MLRFLGPWAAHFRDFLGRFRLFPGLFLTISFSNFVFTFDDNDWSNVGDSSGMHGACPVTMVT